MKGHTHVDHNNNLTEVGKNHEHTMNDGLEIFWSYFQTDQKYLIFSAVTFLHVASFILIVTTAYMFVRHRILRTAEHIIHLNLLLSDSLLLLSDLAWLAGSAIGCEVYSLSFLVLGCSSTYTVAAIAYARYEKMVRSSSASHLTKHPVLCVTCIWAASLITSILPIGSKAHQIFVDDFSSGHACYFVSGLIYKTIAQPIVFLVLVILMPAGVMSFCYIRIYQNVRQARIARWLNQATHFYSAHTRIIEGHSRRANIVPRKISTSQNAMQPNTISNREKHIIVKGIFSVVSQQLFWVPFSLAWLVNTSSGFRQELVLKQIYIMILAKCSVITNICHYISFNVKFRKLYIKTLINPIQKLCCSNATINDRNVSQTISETVFDRNISNLSHTMSELVFNRPSVNSEPLRKGTDMVSLRRISEDVTDRVNDDRKHSTQDTGRLSAFRRLSMPSRCNAVIPIQDSSDSK